MSPDEYARLSKRCAEREEAWRAQAVSSHPSVFTHHRWQIQALIFLAGLIVVLGAEAWKGIMG